MSFSIAKLLTDTAQKYPEKTAVSFMGHSFSYAQMDAWSNSVAAHLVESGLQPGNRVGLYCINSPHFVAAYFGIVKAGGVVVPLNLLLHPSEVAFLLNDSGAQMLIFHAAKDKAVEAMLPAVESVTYVISIGDTQLQPHVSFESIIANPAEPVLIEPKSADDLAVLLYTGGTTGLPKGAMLSHANLDANSDSTVANLFMNPDDVIITVLPMFHSFGAMAGFLSPIRAGATIVALPQFAPEMVCNVIEQTKATVFLGVPTMYAMMLNLPEQQAADLGSLRCCVSGGAPMPLTVQKGFQARYNVTVWEGYGPTECSPVVSVNPLDGENRYGTIGLPVKNVQVKILDDEGNEMPRSEIGELCVSGPNVMLGYYNRPEETKNVFHGEWLRTGDLAKMDEDGYLTIVDRAKDLIIVTGINVYPRQVEDVIYKYPGVAEAAVIGVPDQYRGERVKAFVAPKTGVKITPKAIIEHCREHLGRFEVPRRVEILETLPKSGAGKILRRKLRDMEMQKKS